VLADGTWLRSDRGLKKKSKLVDFKEANWTDCLKELELWINCSWTLDNAFPFSFSFPYLFFPLVHVHSDGY